MIPTCYIAGVEKKSFWVCGINLHPLTLAHAMTLYMAESPFVVPESSAVTTESLLLAAAICGRATPISAGDIPNLVGDLNRMKIASIEDETRKMEEYISYWTSSHDRFTTEQEPYRIPWPWMLLFIMESECGMSTSDALKLPCTEALWRMAASGCRHGSKEYATIKELAIMGDANG